MLKLERYTADKKVLWDELVQRSRNGIFLFCRDYMDYHSNRFVDCSYLIFRNNRVEGILPGNIENKTFFSHKGLTFGGIVSSTKLSAKEIVEVFELLNAELRIQGVESVVYKPVPLIYHTIPAQEDIYALFLNQAKKIGCNLSSTIYRDSKLKFIESRKSGIRKSIRAGVEIHESHNFSEFWKVLEHNLANKHNTKPVHSIDEIELLRRGFPENIRLFIAELNGNIIAGSVLYINQNVVHVQYISASQEGKEIGALDLLFSQLINQYFNSYSVFDFGQSTEQMGNYLNESLIFQKEGFGGRGTVYEQYEYSI